MAQARKGTQRRPQPGASAGDAGDGAPPAGPDDELLRLCDRLAELASAESALRREWGALATRGAPDAETSGLLVRACHGQWLSTVIRLGRTPAATPAGIYAKALALRTCHGSPRVLTLSLIGDLLAPEIRAVLWPGHQSGLVPRPSSDEPAPRAGHRQA